ncbi:MAG: pyrophosphatase [Saprospirales bacterium]|nr:MAG: pyrophosphatase [Saprospirales bacterium]
MTIREFQERTDDWIKDYGVRYFDEKTNMLVLMEEVGELSRLMARVYGEQSFKKPGDALNARDKIGEELADIIFVIGCLSNQMNIDLESQLERNFEKKTIRDRDRHKNNPDLM